MVGAGAHVLGSQWDAARLVLTGIILPTLVLSAGAGALLGWTLRGNR